MVVLGSEVGTVSSHFRLKAKVSRKAISIQSFFVIKVPKPAYPSTKLR